MCLKMKNNKILVVDDDPNIREVLSILLQSENYDVEEALNGRVAVEKALKEDAGFALVILDIMMPEIDGIEVCRKIRERSTVPVLFLTAKSRDKDKIDAYTGGGDDFLVKPFSRMELVMKVRSLIRRSKEYNHNKDGDPDNATKKIVDNIVLDIRKRTVFKDEVRINLTDKEFDILQYFMDHRGDVVLNRDLYEGVWGEKYLPSASNTIMVHVLNLRKKLEDDANKPRIITTVWGKGYRIE